MKVLSVIGAAVAAAMLCVLPAQAAFLSGASDLVIISAAPEADFASRISTQAEPFTELAQVELVAMALPAGSAVCWIDLTAPAASFALPLPSSAPPDPVRACAAIRPSPPG